MNLVLLKGLLIGNHLRSVFYLYKLGFPSFLCHPRTTLLAPTYLAYRIVLTTLVPSKRNRLSTRGSWLRGQNITRCLALDITSACTMLWNLSPGCGSLSRTVSYSPRVAWFRCANVWFVYPRTGLYWGSWELPISVIRKWTSKARWTKIVIWGQALFVWSREEPASHRWCWLSSKWPLGSDRKGKQGTVQIVYRNNERRAHASSSREELAFSTTTGLIWVLGFFFFACSINCASSVRPDPD